MSIQYQFFIMPITAAEQDIDEMNRFLRGVRVIKTHKEFVQQGENSFWALCIEYLAGASTLSEKEKTASSKRRIDYKETLSPADFALFAQLPEWRKVRADREGVPVYTLFTNEQLAQISEKRIHTRSGLQELDGIGEGRIQKYGEDVIRIVNMMADKETKNHEAKGKSVSPDRDDG